MRSSLRIIGILSIALCAIRDVGIAIASTVFDLLPRLQWRSLPPMFGFEPMSYATPAGTPVDAPTYFRNRHEAGIARLGAVRHT